MSQKACKKIRLLKYPFADHTGSKNYLFFYTLVAHQECPPDTKCGKDDMYCPGPWKDGEKCPPPSTCMPMKSGDCWNVCPSNCPEKSCPGPMGPDGCPVADTCMPNDCK